MARYFLGDPKGLSLLLESVDIYRSLNDKTNICDALIIVNLASGDDVQKHTCLEEALALARRRGDLR